MQTVATVVSDRGDDQNSGRGAGADGRGQLGLRDAGGNQLSGG